MKINQILAVENFSDPAKVDWVKQEAAYLLKLMETDPNLTLADRFDVEMSPSSLLQFFRHKERTEKICQIIQYLLSFLDHIPTSGEIRDEPVNPAEQFRSFLHYEADLLLEEDVKDAVFKETNHKNHPHAGGVWDFQERIIVMNRKFKSILSKEENSVANKISNQCRVLEQLSLFWFDVRCHDLRRARRSDIFLYLLAQLVRNRCRKETMM